MSGPSWIGQTLNDRYRIDELLGQGGMSAVYKATDPNLNRVVAVKLIHPHLSDNTEFVRRFEEEAKAVAQLRHPNIIQVFDFNRDGDTFYMVLEFVPGETLQDRLKRLDQVGRRLSMDEVLNYSTDVCKAVDYAHRRGMIHRDIKPANIMLDVHGKAILMDFGIAKLLGGEQHTATGAVVGTAMYMSPEQIQGERPDERADIYSMGVNIFEMISGRPPFEADSAMTLMMMHVNDPVPNLHQIHPDVPDDLVLVVDKALAKKREDRYQSAVEMEAALNKVGDQLTGPVAVVATMIEEPEIESTLVEEPPPVEAAAADEPLGDDGGPEKTFVEAAAAGAIASTLVDEPQADGPPASEVVEATTGGAIASTLVEEPQVDGPPASEVVEATTPDVPSPVFAGETAAPVDTTAAADAPSAGAIAAAGAAAAPPGSGAYESSAAAPAGAPPAEGGRNMTLIYGGAAALIVLACIVIGGIFFYPRIFGGDGGAIAIGQPSETPPPTATFTETLIPTATSTSTVTPLPTSTSPPTDTPTPSLTPTATVPPGIPFVRINDITVDEGNHYVVAYETFEYTEQLPGMHVHFFFDTVPPEEAGVPGNGPWILYGGPRPFTEYTVNNRPASAMQICALVANANHSVQPDSGTCFDLPDSP